MFDFPCAALDQFKGRHSLIIKKGRPRRASPSLVNFVKHEMHTNKREIHNRVKTVRLGTSALKTNLHSTITERHRHHVLVT